VKKLLLLAVAAGLGYLGYRKWADSQREDDVWAKATDPVPPRDLR